MSVGSNYIYEVIGISWYSLNDCVECGLVVLISFNGDVRNEIGEKGLRCWGDCNGFLLFLNVNSIVKLFCYGKSVKVLRIVIVIYIFGVFFNCNCCFIWFVVVDVIEFEWVYYCF